MKLIKINESQRERLFESTNSRRADRQTLNIMTQRLGSSVDSEMIIDRHSKFKKYYFGSEGVNDDWFIVLEPNFYVIADEIGAFSNTEIAFRLRQYIQYLHAKCMLIELKEGRQAMLNYISKFKNTVVDYESFKTFWENEDSETNDTDTHEQVFNEGNYTVIGPVTFEVAHYFGAYTDSPYNGDVMCYTKNINTWNEYTCDGSKAMYIMLTDNWDMLDYVNFHYDNKDAYDEYGLSMIFVIVDEEGDLDTCNVRWNHDADFPKDKFTDLALYECEISDLIGKPFSEVFKPLQEVGYMPIEKVEQLTGEKITQYE